VPATLLFGLALVALLKAERGRSLAAGLTGGPTVAQQAAGDVTFATGEEVAR
jgi:hypothetical protein